MKYIFKNILILILFLHLQPTAFTQSAANFPRLEPDPKALEFFQRGTENNGFSWTDLAEISLWASGANPSAYLGQIRSASEAIRRSPEFPATDRERAEFILNYMHRNLLRSYSLTQSGINTLLSTGRFNCVSSAVLYTILCKSVELEVSGVMTRNHAFAILHIGGENIDVETTNRFGFDPGNRREFHDEFGRLTGFTYVPAQNYRDRQTITPIELISLIISNQISELERRNRFTESVPLAIDRSALLTGSGPRSNTHVYTSTSIFGNPRQDLMSRLYNYGAFLLNSNREEDCLRWLAIAAPLYPDEERWPELVQAAVNNRVARFVRSNNLTEARIFLEAQRTAISPVNYAQLDTMLVDTELLNNANRIRNAADGDSVITAIEEARVSGRIGERRAVELLTFAVQRTATIISTCRDWLSAINYIENAIDRFGSNRELEQSLRNYRANRAADFHNRFATAWNRRNFEEARQILDEGLAEFPNDRQLLANREIVNRHQP